MLYNMCYTAHYTPYSSSTCQCVRISQRLHASVNVGMQCLAAFRSADFMESSTYQDGWLLPLQIGSKESRHQDRFHRVINKSV